MCPLEDLIVTLTSWLNSKNTNYKILHILGGLNENIMEILYYIILDYFLLFVLFFFKLLKVVYVVYFNIYLPKENFAFSK